MLLKCTELGGEVMGVSVIVNDFLQTKIINSPLSELSTITPTLYTDSPFSLMALHGPLNIQLQATSMFAFCV